MHVSLSYQVYVLFAAYCHEHFVPQTACSCIPARLRASVYLMRPPLQSDRKRTFTKRMHLSAKEPTPIDTIVFVTHIVRIADLGK